MGAHSMDSTSSSATRAAPTDDQLKAGGVPGAEGEKAPRSAEAEPARAAADAAAAEKGQRSDRDQDGVKLENGHYIVGLTGPDDPFSPLNYSLARKWLVVVVVSLGSACVTCASSAITLTYKGAEATFHQPQEVLTLGLALFVLGLGIGPLFLGPLSEFYGRRPIYILAFVFFLAFTFGVAFATSIAGLIICRFFSGLAGSAYLSIAGGSIADMFAPAKIGLPMAVFSASPFLGPVLGPVVSGFINENVDWRWTWRVFLIWVGCMLLSIILFVPETFLPRLLAARAKQLRKSGRPEVKAPMDLDERSIPQVIVKSCVTPFMIGATEPMAFVLCLLTALLLGILYLFFGAFATVYGDFGFSTQQIGMSFIPLGVGIIIGTCFHPVWSREYRKVAQATGARPPAEAHLLKSLWGLPLIPISLFWFAWTTAEYVSSPWPSLVATIPFGVGLVWCFQAVFTYLVDAYRSYAASAMALNSAMRSTFACVFPLFGSYMYARLGAAWATSLLAFLCLALTPFPFLFARYGAKYRKGSKYAFSD